MVFGRYLLACLLLATLPALAGYDYQYYEGDWTQLPDFDQLTPAASGVVETIDLTVKQRDDQFALQFTAQITVTTADSYTFYTNSDDGSQLFIDGALVVDNDGLHAAAREASGTVALEPGEHTLTVTYFEQGGGRSSSRSPGAIADNPRQPLPADRRHRRDRRHCTIRWPVGAR
jgi:hypothetical protein